MSLPQFAEPTGFLFHEAGTITGVRWESFSTAAGDWLTCQLSIRRDGATEDITRGLFAGDATGFTVTTTGQLVAESEDTRLSGRSEFSQFINSVYDHADAALKAALEACGTNFSCLVGLRMKFMQVENEARTESKRKAGKLKTNPKTGKPYAERDLVVEKVYGFADYAQNTTRPTQPAPSVQTGGPIAGTRTTSHSSEPAGVVMRAYGCEPATQARAAEVLSGIMKGNGGIMVKTKLRLEAIKALAGHPDSATIQGLLMDDQALAQLCGQVGCVYDLGTQTVTLN